MARLALKDLRMAVILRERELNRLLATRDALRDLMAPDTGSCLRCFCTSWTM